MKPLSQLVRPNILALQPYSTAATNMRAAGSTYGSTPTKAPTTTA